LPHPCRVLCDRVGILTLRDHAGGPSFAIRAKGGDYEREAERRPLWRWRFRECSFAVDLVLTLHPSSNRSFGVQSSVAIFMFLYRTPFACVGRTPRPPRPKRVAPGDTSEFSTTKLPPNVTLNLDPGHEKRTIDECAFAPRILRQEATVTGRVTWIALSPYSGIL
jgi:hypothetical protein